jgi:serine/threonine-protein kinase HipA
MSRIGKVIYQTDFAGIISEDEDGYHFQYDAQYLNMANAQAISLTIPLQNKLLNSNILFPFFDGLIPEGWLMDIAI